MIKLRAPSVPLITVDPYFSVWSPSEKLNFVETVHWTGKPNTLRGYVTIDGERFVFMGDDIGAKKIKQTSLSIDALSTKYTFETEKIKLDLRFMTPLLMDDLYVMSRPVSYLGVTYTSKDEEHHKVEIEIYANETLCLNYKDESECTIEKTDIGNIHLIKMGNSKQNPLNQKGDDVRINWGYFYLACVGNTLSVNEKAKGEVSVKGTIQESKEALILFAYDDTYSINYFGTPLKSYWNKDGKTIDQVISEAVYDYEIVKLKSDTFSQKLYAQARDAGGEEYADLVSLAYRQAIAAHKLCVTKTGEILFISKECFSNGCAATVDVTYPSAPMYLLYNTELLKGMLRPVFRYASTQEWTFDFAPHDVGQYPLVNGQVYGDNKLKYQMPVEECGNMIILVSAICKKDNDYSFAEENMELLDKWSKYLVKYGKDPEHQLCTDDFAGHLSHNCNLSLKAIMGMTGFSKILRHFGRNEEADELLAKAQEYADSFIENAKNPDGSYRLAYDREGTFSLKYNSVWDKIWKTGLLPEEFFRAEIERYKKEALPYGVPLDSREKYTKSDWLIWAACLTDNKDDFEFFAAILWNAYNTMRTRVPMTDWYYADTSEMVGFRHRTVQGGLFIRLMM